MMYDTRGFLSLGILLLTLGQTLGQSAVQSGQSGDIPPNLGFYTLDPLYQPGISLGWAQERIEEKIDRGLVAIPLGDGRVYLGWRLLKTDRPDTAFNVYRISGPDQPRKVNNQPIVKTTDFVDTDVPADRVNIWFIRAVVDGQEQRPSERVELHPDWPIVHYKAIDLNEDVRSVAMVGIGDLDGDGTYDFVVKHPGFGKDPGRVSPNRGSYKYDAYNGKTGRFMWRIDLGWNVDMGIWWTPMVIRDLDGDNKAEVCVRGSVYAATAEQMLPSGRKGFLLDAPEFLIVYDGQTGRELDRAPWIELGQPRDWGDYTGNRASRHMLGVAYLDGKTPAVLALRGTYGLMKVDAYVFKDKKLQKLWRWTNEKAPFLYHGQGQHSVKTADIDGDGCDEILNGSVAIDNDGKTLWSTGYGHGDRFYLGDIDPDRPGLEIWYIFEDPHPHNGASLWDARTGNLIWGIPVPSQDNELGHAIAGDIDPNYPGMEVAAEGHFYSCKGQKIPGPSPAQDFLIWWDADLLREIYSRARIYKWKGDVLATIPGQAHQIADILGDWREEVVVVVQGQLRIYTTTIPAIDRRVCLMQDPLYRNDVTHRTVGYPHYPMTSYYLGVR
ncbi:MAG: rhamnogalacturonan lyase [Sedimentisphaerales bacterium]|jgi:rhamnogalacturonan endolyase|nr:rhamnogalacturonan lyase [Sedimentisphaerales bacterium]